METQFNAFLAGVPRQRLTFSYDHQSRRISKKVEDWRGGHYQERFTMLFVYDGWNLVAEYLQTGPKIRTHVWGSDLSGGTAAGGIGGLLFINQYPENKTYSVGYDGNGNIMALFDMATSREVAASYEYGPFGEPRYIPAQGNDRETVSITLDHLIAEQYPAAFEQIMPGFYESLTDTTIEQAVMQNQLLSQRLSAVRLGVRGFSAIGIESPIINDRNGKNLMDAGENGGLPAPTTDNKWGIWVQGNGIFAKTVSPSQIPKLPHRSRRLPCRDRLPLERKPGHRRLRWLPGPQRPLHRR